ncbi:chemotaxis protein CheB [Pseudonocardia kujensis]|uniref:chemotaxis protein CheB n=1 Tax=Pseudonocardia kujensis TaxID=1128675 RepID=UPI001E35058C|nr:chemotaxis protein CheB [Pseudonocardia kujensis]MCE0763844.1 chemotaxis protein CheB [Pseudonocardia kujensis]
MAGDALLVIGASAGGVEALVELVAGLPPDLPAAVLVTVHTGDRPRTTLGRVLARAGPLPADQAADGEPLRAGRILVAAPDRHLLVRRDGGGDTAVLSTGPKVNRHRPAVDAMFASAVRARGPRVVATVLSGALDDGAVGAALVDRAGGRVLVQDPADALFDSMPRAAVAAVPDARAAPAAELGRLLATTVQELPVGGDGMTDTPDGPGGDDGMAASRDPAYLRPDESAATRMGCPECGGGLARIDLPHIGYFRCHVGHQYSPRSLEAAQREAAEAKLWTAIAALEEHAALARFLEQGADSEQPSEYALRAEHSAETARLMRERLLGGRAT